jgi:hypothetical protein
LSTDLRNGLELASIWVDRVGMTRKTAIDRDAVANGIILSRELDQLGVPRRTTYARTGPGGTRKGFAPRCDALPSSTTLCRAAWNLTGLSVVGLGAANHRNGVRSASATTPQSPGAGRNSSRREAARSAGTTQRHCADCQRPQHRTARGSAPRSRVDTHRSRVGAAFHGLRLTPAGAAW